MLKSNPLQFAVVREDPEIEIRLFRSSLPNRAVLIGSGGCTAFALAGEFPTVPLTLIEPNPAQVDLIRRKVKALTSLRGRERQAAFGVGRLESARSSLIEGGNFEALFAAFREFVFRFVVPERTLESMIKSGTRGQWLELFKHPYWPVAFETFFADPLLKVIFGPAAIRHAPPKSYPAHFRGVIEEGLLRSDRKRNYFLHHIFFGRYASDRRAWPLYLRRPPHRPSFIFFEGFAQDFPNYGEFDFVALSNIFDWSSESEVRSLARRLATELPNGACVLYRQLNHGKNFERFFGPRFRWATREAARLHRADRSLFYTSLHIGRVR